MLGSVTSTAHAIPLLRYLQFSASRRDCALDSGLAAKKRTFQLFASLHFILRCRSKWSTSHGPNSGIRLSRTKVLSWSHGQCHRSRIIPTNGTSDLALGHNPILYSGKTLVNQLTCQVVVAQVHVR